MLDGLAHRSGPDGDRMITATACYGLGAAYANRGELGRALQELDRALMLMPDYQDARRLREEIAAAHRP
jgi:Tfp pilus assembly protein PilF